jgi:hypothetical protein
MAHTHMKVQELACSLCHHPTSSSSTPCRCGSTEFSPQNKTAEYKALLAGLDLKQLVVRDDSQLVVNQVNKQYECLQMAAYVEEVH